MNLGQAAAVVLYEVGRGDELRSSPFAVRSKGREPELNAEAQRRRSEGNKRRKAGSKERYLEEGREKNGPPQKAGAAGDDLKVRKYGEMEVVERVGETLLEALVKSGYVGPRSRELAEEKLRRMLRRFSMEAADAEVFLGMMRKIVEEMDRSG
jgi:tRNA C32,U32 (ribose-2'-O)-methylase TrmJ